MTILKRHRNLPERNDIGCECAILNIIRSVTDTVEAQVINVENDKSVVDKTNKTLWF